MNVNNLMLLQKQQMKPLKIMLLAADCLLALLVLILWTELGEELVVMFGGLLLLLLYINLMAFKAGKHSIPLKMFPPEVLGAVNEKCLTGLRFGNGILCDNDCLVIIGNMAVTIVMLKEVARMELRTFRKGQIFLASRNAPCGAGSDSDFLLTRAAFASMYSDLGIINGAERRVKGAGTFREADRDVFWKALCTAWKKYTDAEPVIS